MTKLLQQLNFSSSNNYYYDVAGIEPPSEKLKLYNGEGASLSACGGSKRSALSESDAECFSLCLGAGPLCSAPPGGVGSGAASPAAPATPTHDDNHRDLLSALLWSSASSLAGEGAADGAHPTQDHARNEAIIEKILARRDRATKINFKVYLTEHNYTRWECVLKGDVMYLRLPDSLSAGSKEAFMFLLDFAEERLHCTHWIICVNKAREDRTTILRTFMFLGFQILPPNSPMASEINNPDYLLMHYNYD